LRRTLEFTLSDGDGGISDPTGRHILINRRPMARYDRAATAHDVPIVLPLARLLRNDADDDNDPVSIVELEGVSDEGSTLTATETNITYQPRPGFAGNDFFTYRIADGRGGEATGIVGVRVVADREIMVDDIVPSEPGVPAFARIVGAGRPGDLYVIYASTDYTAWTLVGSSEAGLDGLLLFLDHEVEAYPARFYRLETP
jgi:hypothetical protein